VLDSAMDHGTDTDNADTLGHKYSSSPLHVSFIHLFPPYHSQPVPSHPIPIHSHTWHCLFLLSDVAAFILQKKHSFIFSRAISLPVYYTFETLIPLSFCVSILLRAHLPHHRSLHCFETGLDLAETTTFYHLPNDICLKP
jgi:hypothetical protein